MPSPSKKNFAIRSTGLFLRRPTFDAWRVAGEISQEQKLGNKGNQSFASNAGVSALKKLLLMEAVSCTEEEWFEASLS